MSASSGIASSPKSQQPQVAVAKGSPGEEGQIYEKALAFLREWHLVPRPYAYEVAYLYFEGGYEDIINRPIDAMIDKSNAISEYDIQQIHAELRGGMYGHVWEKLDHEMRNVDDIVARQTSANSSYSKSLSRQKKEISTVTTVEQFRDMITVLIRENERIIAQTDGLRSELKKSSAQIGKLRSKLEQARDKELEDPLTQIGNRRYFDEWMEKEYFAATNEGTSLCLAIADIDHFKQVNDTFGHPVGDAVLCFFAQLIRNNVKGRDRIARYGGEEFAIILPETKLRHAVKLIDKIRRGLFARNIVIVEDNMDIGKVSASFGIAELKDGQTIEAFIKTADARLYDAKRSGRNCIKF